MLQMAKMFELGWLKKHILFKLKKIHHTNFLYCLYSDLALALNNKAQK